MPSVGSWNTRRIIDKQNLRINKLILQVWLIYSVLKKGNG